MSEEELLVQKIEQSNRRLQIVWDLLTPDPDYKPEPIIIPIVWKGHGNE
jgi:hypothetical protein